MQRYKDVFDQACLSILRRHKAPKSFSLVTALILVLTTLACALGRTISSSPAGRAVTHTPSPTFTQTPTSDQQAVTLVPSPTTPAQAATSLTFTPPPRPTLTPTPTVTPRAGASSSTAAENTVAPTTSPTSPLLAITEATATPLQPVSNNWSFVGLRVQADQEADGLLLYGELVNNTGSSQELDTILGTFYDESGRVIAGAEDTDDDWPVDIVPPGGRVPFVLAVDNAASDRVANFELRVEAGMSQEIPRQDFEFLRVSQWMEDNEYCVAGELRNPGDALRDDLVVVVVLYDDQDRVVNFEDDGVLDPEIVVGDQTWDFEMCVDSPNEDVARYELRAWGL